MDMNGRLQTCYAAYQSGDLQSAEQQYHSMISEQPNLGDAHHLGALIAGKAGRGDIAKLRIEAAVAAQPRHHEYRNTQGNILAGLQDEIGARKAYKASLAAKPDYISAAQNYGKFLIDHKDALTAVDIYKNALKHNGQDQQLRIGHVIALKDALKTDEALKEFEKLNGGYELEHLHGQILSQLSRHDAAFQAYGHALKKPNVAATAIKNYLQLLWMRGTWGKAGKIVDDILQTANAATFIAVARSFTLAEEHKQAGEVLEKALQKFGREPYVLSERARMKLMSGDYESGYQDALEALTAMPGDLKIMEDFADTALASGRHNDAMTAAHEALKVVPNNQYWIAIKYTAGRAMGQNHGYYANYDKFVRPFELTPPEGYGSVAEYNQVLKQTLDEIHEYTQHPLDQSLRSGVQTPIDLRYVDHPVLKAHFKALEAPIRAYMSEIANTDPNHPLLRRNTGGYRITGSWSARLSKGGFHVNHVHPEGWISSAYYVDVPDEVNDETQKSGWIHFGQPPYPVKDQNGNLLGHEKIVKPKVGTLVLFPSYLWHGTNPLQGDKTRMTLPIDVVPA